MFGKTILSQQAPIDNRIVSSQVDPAWLEEKIDHYQKEIERLEAELKHVKVLLKGHQTWLADIERQASKRGER